MGVRHDWRTTESMTGERRAPRQLKRVTHALHARGSAIPWIWRRPLWLARFVVVVLVLSTLGSAFPKASANAGSEVTQPAAQSIDPTAAPAPQPSALPSEMPTDAPTADPTAKPKPSSTPAPTVHRTPSPAPSPSAMPSHDSAQTSDPTPDPAATPTPASTPGLNADPTSTPTEEHSVDPTANPTSDPTPPSSPDPTPEPTTESTRDPEATSTPAPDPSATPSPEAAPEPTLAPAPTTSPSQVPVATTSYIVTFRAASTATQHAAALAAVGGVETASIPELQMARVELVRSSAPADAAALAADQAVRSVERDHSRDAEAAPADPHYPEQWSLPRIGWDTLHAKGLPAGSVIVAVLDTGVDARQPDLRGRLLPGLSFVDGSPADTDPHGHGTWLTGIVVAAGDNGIGISGIGGPGVRVLPITVLSADGTGQDSAVISGIVAAVDAGADVILMAFSNPGYSPALQAAVDYAWAHDAVLVAANGNDGTTNANYPAGDRGVMGIVATDQSDQLAQDSNHGPQTFLAAPGVDILTTAANADSDPLTDDEYRSVSGTSAAAAEVAGAAAVLRALDEGATNAVIVGRLARSAAPIGTQAQTGNGRLDLARAATDTGTEEVTPAGVAGSAIGGPFVGPYVAASPKTDCFRSFVSGTWAATGTWESAPIAGGCTVWTAATLAPTSAASTITIRNGHTVTVAAIATVDEVTVDIGGQVTVNSGITLTLNNGAGTDLTANGTVLVNGTLTAPALSATVVSGTLTIGGTGTLNGLTTASFTVNSGGNLSISSGGTFSGGTGSLTVSLGGSATNAGTFNGGPTLTVNGTMSSSTSITLAATSALQVGGTLTMTGGTFTTQRASAGSVGSINSGGSIILSGAAVWSIGTVATATATVASGGTLDIGPSAVVSGAGLLTVASGANLKIGSTAGIDASTTTGNVRTTATDSYSTTANYEYKGTAAQITGVSLPATVNNLTINDSGGNVTLTNAATTVSGVLTLTSGDLSTGAGTNVLTLAATATCSGTTDVISASTGGVSRTTIVVGTTYCFGNPQNQITINSGTAPTALKVKLVKAVPAAKANAVTRTYTITPTGGGVFAATVRLHYLDAELNSNPEAQLHIWRLNGSWTDQDPDGSSTTRDTAANWVEQSGIASFALPDWTLAKNDPPVLTPTVANLAYVENGTTVLDSGITASDVDSTNLTSATVTLTTNYVNGEDTLAFVNQNGITGTWTPASGVLLLSGSATLAFYQTALRSITYTDTSDAPSVLTRTVTFVANDGTSNSTTASRQITLTAVNDAPAGTNKTVTTNEDTGYLFTTADFGFSDATDGGANTLLAVKIATLPATGSLKLSGVAVTVAQFVSAANISSGLLVFTPAANANGAANASFTFQVQDNGGTANGGVDLDQSPNTMTIDVTAVNNVPSFTKGADQTVLEDAAAQSVATWATALSAGPADESGQLLNFIVSNTNNPLFSVQPAVSAAGTLSYTPAADANGSATVSVQIHDNGGVANGGVDTSAIQTFTITLTPVNDPPSFTKGADQAVAQNAGAQSTGGWATAISAGPANEASQVVDFIVSNNFNGLFSAQPAITATGTLTYTPAAGAAGIATVTVQIHDNGGTTNAGVDTSASQTFTISVSDGAYISSTGWSTSFDTSRYLDLTFPAYVPTGSLVTGGTFRHSYRSATGGDTTCYYFEVYSGATLIATHGSSGSPVSCNAGTTYVTDVISLPEVDTVAEANGLTIRLYVKNSGGRRSLHQLGTLGVDYSHD